MNDYDLVNNESEGQYEFHIESYIPKIEYIKSNNGEIFLTHTEVPVALEGNGIGTELVRMALNDIDEKGLKLIPLCPFVAAYVRNNPEWKRILMKGINV